MTVLAHLKVLSMFMIIQGKASVSYAMCMWMYTLCLFMWQEQQLNWLITCVCCGCTPHTLCTNISCQIWEYVGVRITGGMAAWLFSMQLHVAILFISVNGFSDTSLHDFDHYDQPLLLLLVLQPVVCQSWVSTIELLTVLIECLTVLLEYIDLSQSQGIPNL